MKRADLLCLLLPWLVVGDRFAVLDTSTTKDGRTVSATGQHAPFGARLRRLREAAGLTQEELAERAGLTAKGISDLERGRRRRPYPHTVRSLADALGLSEGERGSLFAAVPKRDDAGPATSSAVAKPTLPSPPTMLVGRDRELAEVEDSFGVGRCGC